MCGSENSWTAYLRPHLLSCHIQLSSVLIPRSRGSVIRRVCLSRTCGKRKHLVARSRTRTHGSLLLWSEDFRGEGMDIPGSPVVDSRRGLTTVFKGIPVQLCQVSPDRRRVTKYLTLRPATLFVRTGESNYASSYLRTMKWNLQNCSLVGKKIGTNSSPKKHASREPKPYWYYTHKVRPAGRGREDRGSPDQHRQPATERSEQLKAGAVLEPQDRREARQDGRAAQVIFFVFQGALRRSVFALLTKITHQFQSLCISWSDCETNFSILMFSRTLE